MITPNEKIKTQTRMKGEKIKMKNNFSLFALLFSFTTVFAQTNLSTAENYVYTKNCLDADCIKKSETVQYFDGLGRPIQTVAIKATPLGRDVVMPVEYDSKGREAKSYLPVPQAGTTNGAIYTNPLGNASSAGYGNEKIYAEKIYDNIYTGRVNQMVPAGTAWSQKPVNMTYNTNADGEVKKYVLTTDWTEGRTNSAIGLPGSYVFNQLNKTSITDQDGNTTTEFQNGEGQTILVRKNDGQRDVDTYYLYNEFGQLAYVIPPLAVSQTIPDQALLDKLCYQYRYDGLGRLVEKKVPGKGWEYMVYDKADRLILTQDANLRAKGQWLFTKYDQFSRPVYSGILDSPPGRLAQVSAIEGIVSNIETRSTSSWNNSGIDVFYTNNIAYPTTNFKLLSVNYYDTYPSYSFNPAFPTTILGQTIMTDTQNASVNTQAMPTLGLVKNMEDDNWTKSYAYYDTKGRSVGTYTINHLGGYTRTETELDFVGVAKQSKVYHKRFITDTEKVISQSFEYDNQNRVMKHRHQVGSGPVELLTENTYNELSQLSNKKVGGGLESIDYQYDIRGALTKVNDPAALGIKLFGYDLKYFNPQNTGSSIGKYNGNITEVTWKTASDQVLRQYNYQYDALNRLKKGIYSEPGASVPQNGFFNETLAYDLNGNITSLQRNGKSDVGTIQLIDDLAYNYTGNRLNTVTDTSGNYSGYPDTSGNIISYDDNGNMKDHIDKGVLQIDYNLLNLPDYIKFDKGIVTRGGIINENIYYTYRADGTKLKKIYNYTPTFVDPSGTTTTLSTKVTEYLDGFQYENKTGKSGGGTLILKFVPTAEGYYNFENNKYIYSYTDHLGNVRLSYSKTSSGSAEVLEENNYYPFGLKHEGYNILYGNPAYNYEYNGKELQKETGWSDYGARMYLSDIGRWGVIDPLAEQMRRYSPYNYAFNNPVSFIDPDGRKPQTPDAEAESVMFPKSLWSFYMGGGSTDKDALMDFIAQNNGWGAFQDLLKSMDLGGGESGTFGETQAFRDIMAAFYFGGIDFNSPPDDFIFNEKGQYVRTEKNKLSDRFVVENSKSGSKQYYSFADPINDPKDIANGIITNYIFVSKTAIASMLRSQGAFNSNNKNSYINFYTESKGGGKFDYSYSILPLEYYGQGVSMTPLDPKTPSHVLFLPEGDRVVHNHMNFGNYLWGASGYTLGFSFSTLQMAAHLNSKINSNTNGYKSQWDSKDDQYSIVLGAYYSMKNRFRNIK
ncbi:RHS repeat-associated core domain-containing protein [Chryseobacterium antibioticum]|uniref:RHS repeat-associated core domain-containing protein n=1 Tax=Chryseobacterium pyrolae TaxID=2987481 RepID=A0ABT2IHY5_9FLAO|nr:RHS repeat-associated core domain-containing protein [Chryseobacterium pyrolae]MCT2408267.1 RHS repeat-associated core domain-containing protein [Chryseobacterium pyrolae]